jgi:hypothetical protein
MQFWIIIDPGIIIKFVKLYYCFGIIGGFSRDLLLFEFMIT